MALFKIHKGSASDLGKAGNITHAAHEGYAYFTPDDGKFYIDTATADTAVIGTNRIPLNAYQADLLGSADKGGPTKPFYLEGGLPVNGGGVSIEYIEGTQTAATNLWKGVTSDSSVYVGKVIAYKLPKAGNSSAATLTLTLADGTSTHTATLRRMGSNVTTHYPAGSVIFLVYDGSYWQTDGDYNTNDDYRVRMVARGTNKAYLLGTTTAPTSSNQNVTSVAETGVYFDTVAAKLVASTFVGSLEGNATSSSKVSQAAATSAANDYRLLLSTSATNDSEVGALNKSSNLRYNPSTNLLSTGNLTLTGNLNVTGNTNLHSQTNIDSLTAGSLIVNGNSSFANDVVFTKIPTAPTAAAGTNNTQLATTAFVMNSFNANDAMIFKGTLGATSGSVAVLPTTDYQAGWTYRVADVGTYAGEYCEVGDLIIAIKDYNSSTASSTLDWAKIEHNIDGAVYMGHAGSAVGSTSQPVYVAANGKVTAITGALGNDITGNAASATKVNKNLVLKISSGTTEGTNLYTFNGSAAKTLDIKANKGISLTAAAGSVTIGHSHTITAKTAALQSAKTLTWGDTFTLYEEKYDTEGHITGIASYNMTMPSNPNTDTKVNMVQRGTTKAYLLGTATAPTSSTQAVTALAETGVYFDTVESTLVAGSFKGSLDGNATSASRLSITSTDNAIARFNGSAGAIQDSLVFVDDNGKLSAPSLLVSGTTTLSGETTADSLTVGNLQVNGSANFVNSPTAPTPAAASNDTSVATTAFVTSKVNASVTGVKGNNESSYRIGNVNLTLANLIGSTAIGSNKKPVYYNGATFTTMATAGNATTPIYINSNGEITAGTAINGAAYKAADYYLARAGGEMTGPLTWANGTALPNTTSADYFLVIDAFANGGTTKYVNKTNALKSLVSSSAIGGTTQPIYYNGSAFVNTTYALKATVNNATANGVAYYSSTTGITSTTAGAANTALMGKGNAAPEFVSVAPNITITEGDASNAPKVNVTALGVSGTAKAITKATTGIYGVTKLSSTASGTEENLAATPKGVQAAINALDVAAIGVTGKYIESIEQSDGFISAALSNTTYGAAYNPLYLNEGEFTPTTGYTIEYIVGTQTAKTGAWTGVTKDIALYPGKVIAYKLPYDGSGNASINLTLNNGEPIGNNTEVSTTGAINAYVSGGTRLTTHYGAGSVIILTYDGTYWRGADYWNSNSRDAGYGRITPVQSTSTAAITPTTAQITAGTYNENIYMNAGNKWIELAATNGSGNHNDAFIIAHSIAENITATTYGDSTAQTPNYGETFNVPTLTVDEAGHITDISTHTVALPASDNTDTTYTFAEGPTNGTFSVTPSGGTAQNVPIHGLGDRAFDSTAYLPLAGGTMTGSINRYYTADSTSPIFTVRSNNKDVDVWQVGHATSATGTISSGYKLQYNGTGSDPNNLLRLYSGSTLIASSNQNGLVTIPGTVILSKKTDASGTANNSPALIIGGAISEAHLELDANELMAKANATTVAPLYLNHDGGLVYINGKKVAKLTADPTSGQIMIADGTDGNIKSSGYTIAKSVPSDAVFTDTKNTTGSTDTSSKIFLIGATTQAANPQTYSDNEVFVTDGTLSTRNLAVSGNTTLSGETEADSLTAGNLIVNGSATFENIINGDISGNAATATADGSGNNIINTYLTKAAGVTNVAWDNTNKKLTKTINGSTSDIVAVTVNNPTLAWNTESVIAKIGTVDVKVKLPANPNTNTDTLVKQTAKTDSVEYKILTTTSASPTSGSAAEAGYGANLAYNPSLNRLSTGNIKLTGELDVTGNAYLRNQTTSDSLTAGSLLVNGNANFIQSPTAPTPASGDNSTKLATTEFVKTSVAGLSGAMHFRGTTTTAMSDGLTTAAVTIGGSSYTPTAGDVVLYSDSEFVWTGSVWERLGRDSSFKTTQSAVDSGTAATNKWVSRIQQNANGNVTVTMGTLDTSGTWSGNAATATAFSSAASIALTGDVTGSASSTKGWSVATTIANNAVTTAKIKDANVTNAKLANSSIKLGNTSISLGGTATSIAGPFAVTTSADATKAFSIQRTGSGEATAIWVDDQYTHFDVVNDETSANVIFTLKATDTESGGGAGAQTSSVTFNGSGGQSTVTANKFSGNGASLTNLNASNISSGTLAAARLPSVTRTNNTSTASPAHSATFTAIDSITTDTYGRITAVNTKTVTLPSDNDTKNTAGSTDTSSKIYLIGATSQATNPQTYSDNEVFVTDGTLSTKNITVSGNTTLSGETEADSLTVGNLQVNGSANFVNTITGNISGNAATATAISPAGTAGQFWRGDSAWSNTLGIPDIDNTAFKNTLILENNRNTESSYATLDETKPSYGIGFNFRWSNGVAGTLAGIYGVGLGSWRAGLAFRVKKGAGSSGTPGTHDQTVAWMSGDGIVVKGKMIINPSYSTLSNSYNEGLRINRASNGWSLIELGGTVNTTSAAGLGTWLIGAKATPADATTAAASITSSHFYVSYNGSDSAACRIQGHNATGFSIRPKLYINTDVPASGTVYNLYVNGTTYLSSDITANGLTASQAVVTDANKKLASRGIRNNTSVGALGWTAAATDITLVTTNTIAYWNGAYTSTTSNLKYSVNGEIMGLSTAQTVSATKTFSAIQKFTNTTDSAHSQDTAAAVSISGGLSVAKKVSAKEVRIDNNQSSKGVSLQYDESLEVLNFVFS